MGLYTGGLIFGMVRVLVNWWAYTWGAYIRGAYIRRFTVYTHGKIESICYLDQEWRSQSDCYNKFPLQSHICIYHIQNILYHMQNISTLWCKTLFAMLEIARWHDDGTCLEQNQDVTFPRQTMESRRCSRTVLQQLRRKKNIKKNEYLTNKQ